MGHQRGPGAYARGGTGGLAAGVTASNDDDIK
jgi:hypothetical protein